MQSRNLEAPSDYRNPNDIPQNATAYSAHGYPDYPAMSTNRANVSHGQPQGPAGATPGLAGAAAVGAGAIAMTDRPGSGRPPNDRLSSYGYGPYGNNSGDLGSIDPHGIADDDDEPFHIPNSRSRQAGSAAAASAGAGGATGFFKGLTSRDASGNYKEVAGGGSAGEPAKSGWLKTQVGGNRRFKLIVGGIIGAVVVLAIIGGSLGAYFGTRDKSTDPNSEEVEKGSDLTKDSDAIKALMGRDDLHKVFPGIDYTPFNSQYPECMHNMPTQNNITMDIAVLSQLTTQVRLYGTDCKQADMVMRAITALELQDSLKMWLGVWLDGNKTTNARQMDQMWDFLDNDKTDGKALAGVIIGNEVLFRKEITLKKLSETLQDVRKKLTQKGYKNIPVTTSDLGSNWTPELAKAVDVVMANVHPFFGGISAKKAASWTWDFWQNNDVAQSKKAGKPKQPNLISEVGWPSSGGSDCGSVAGSDKPVKCKKPGDGAIASIDGINTFMDDWVCESLKNGTQYFWFEAFDEPWKVKFNEKGAEWEDKWGFMTGKRELKDGVKIPDCDGKNTRRCQKRSKAAIELLGVDAEP